MTEKDEIGELVDVVQEEMQFPHPEVYLYTNAAQVSMSGFDIRLSFAETRPEGKPISKGGLVMAPAHFKALAIVLASNVKAYESVYGEIILPNPKKTPEEKKDTKEAKGTKAKTS